jgi:hypothetical protein
MIGRFERPFNVSGTITTIVSKSSLQKCFTDDEAASQIPSELRPDIGF